MPLDDNRLLSALIDRRGVLETLLLNIEPIPAPQSPMSKVNHVVIYTTPYEKCFNVFLTKTCFNIILLFKKQ